MKIYEGPHWRISAKWVMKAWKMWTIISELRAIGTLLEFGPHLTSLTGIQYAERLAESIEQRLQDFIDDVS